MKLTLATWNINSVRLRAGLVVRLLATWHPDVLCLQEIKCGNGDFPSRIFRDSGYPHLAVNGQPGYHGVAIASRLPLKATRCIDFCGRGDARHASVVLDTSTPIAIHSLYVPAGGDEPDPDINGKFAHKLAFLNEMHRWMDALATNPDHPAIVAGDFNIAPLENDVWSHRQLLKVVSHTPAETTRLNAIQHSGGWIDLTRHHVPADQKVYTWWSYRAKNWAAADRGRRLDHIWLDPRISTAGSAVEVVRQARDWERPSDHVPVVASLKL
jgi:exodeoxyribonuclease III